MEKRFDMATYEAGEAEVACDDCGAAIDIRKTMRSREIAKEKDGFRIQEQYFTCPACGKHYTVLIIDREMRKMIQKQKQLRKQIQLYQQIQVQPWVVEKLMRHTESLMRAKKGRMRKLKERYREECSKDE